MSAAGRTDALAVRHGGGPSVGRRWGVSVRAIAAVPAVLALAGCLNSQSGLPRDTQTVGGMTIDIGVMPADLVRGHTTEPGDPLSMHGGTPPKRASHHLVVALFDAKSGERITDAIVRAGVADHDADPVPATVLEPMRIASAMSYGNFFLMSGGADWRIRLEIRRSSNATPVLADFAYSHPVDH